MAESGSDPQDTFLHGDLDLKIIGAQNLPNMDIVAQHLRHCFTACGTIKIPHSKEESDGGDREDHRKVHNHRKIVTSDPYVKVLVPQATVARTRVINNSRNPKWNEQFHIPLAHPVTYLEFEVKDDDIFGAQLIGTVKIPAQKIATGELISDWFTIYGSTGKEPKPGSKLQLEMQFTPFEKTPANRHGIAGDPEQRGVRHTYFPLRRGCSVIPYQDAHVLDHSLPEIELDEGKVYRQEKCWVDICHAIVEAHHLVYIVGWSIYHKVKLVRELESTCRLPSGKDTTLGELLKYKSQEGLRVLMLIWDDKTSHDNFVLKTTGLMQTHDEATKKFFKHSSVTCVLAPRYASSKMGYFKQQVVGTLFTHHQKCVLVDTKASGNDRKITAFLGGIDLCDGRYDTPEHRLFRDLDTVFQDDYHNPTFPLNKFYADEFRPCYRSIAGLSLESSVNFVSTTWAKSHIYKAGTKAPRQPWHDLHCQIDGPAAYDVLINFEQRWRKATKWTEFGLRLKRVSHWHDDALIQIDRISWIRSPPPPPWDSKDGTTYVPKDDPNLWISSGIDDREIWHVQILRSIDSGSLKGFPKKVDAAVDQSLIRWKKLVIDKSIQTGYIQAIRSAQHFIYIENQYFLGSSYAWPSYKNAGADNLIPMELALKIASKIRAKERFAVYIVIPMWPEGDPNSAAMQEILFWQSQTMQMMYNIVAKELQALHPADSHPQEYLNFYCLGKREDYSEESYSDNVDEVSSLQKFKRFMIYVHAKGMIVDDEYVIVGSANINQRSMAGTKDTEIAMGAYQPHHTWAARKKQPHGQVYGYRMSLWAEHLASVDTLFMEPESLECVQKVNKIADDNWKKYTDENFSPLQGHLLKYPIKVDADGTVSSLPGYENFPDIGGRVLGAHSNTLPDTLTT